MRAICDDRTRCYGCSCRVFVAKRCRWRHRIGYACILAEGHRGEHRAIDLGGANMVGWSSDKEGAYRDEKPREET